MERFFAPVPADLVPAMWIRRILSLTFVGLFVFEVLNYFQFLSFHVDYTWLGRFVSTLVMFGALRLIDEGFRRKLGTRLQGKVWLLMTVLLWFDFLGDVFGFYSRWMWYDQVVHFLSGVLLVSCLWIVVRTCATRLQWIVPNSVLAVLVLGINTMFAVLYETEEYLEDVFFGTNRLGDGFDTTNDLLLNLVAGVLVILSLFIWKRFCRRQAQRL